MKNLTAAAAADIFRRPPERFIDVREGEMAYRKIGSGPDVLFVHGWPASGATFRKLLPHLAPHVTCHIIDLVGSGQSRFDRGTRIDLEQHVLSIRRLIDALELEDYAVVGHDSGGMMARHAVVGDTRLRAMALVNTEQPQGLNWRFKQFLFMSKLPNFERVFAWAANQRNLRRNKFLLGDCFADRTLLEGEFDEFFLAPLRDEPERLWAAGQLIRSFDESLAHQLGDIHRRLDVPVQLVWGADDPFFPIDWARDMVATFPQAKLQVVEGAKLFAHEEKPTAVAEAMLPTLAATEVGD